MKYPNNFFYVLLVLLCTCIIKAQSIPNGDFEEWVIGGDPLLWYTNNQYPPLPECIRIYPGAPYSGNISATGTVDSCIGPPVLYPPILTSYDINLNVKPEALHGFYKYFPIGDDLFVAIIQLFLDNNLIGEGTLKSQQTISDFTEFIINIEYTSTEIPDIAIIKFTIDSSIASNKLHQGSRWYIDYLSFGPLSDIDDEQTGAPKAFYLYQNFPNPFNPSTKIRYSVPYSSKVVIKVFDVLGKEIETLVNEVKPAGTYELTWYAEELPSGVYFYRLKAGEFIETKKMILLK